MPLEPVGCAVVKMPEPRPCVLEPAPEPQPAPAAGRAAPEHCCRGGAQFRLLGATPYISGFVFRCTILFLGPRRSRSVFALAIGFCSRNRFLLLFGCCSVTIFWNRAPYIACVAFPFGRIYYYVHSKPPGPPTFVG
jgi:hypothetical protein